MRLNICAILAFGSAFQMDINFASTIQNIQTNYSVYLSLSLESSENTSSNFKNPHLKNNKEISIADTLKVIAEEEKSDTSELEQLEKFRSAFESLIEEKRSGEQEEIQAEAEQQIFLELDGLVTDQTRSKIGRDFYDIFFQQWEAPPNSNNFTIVISEQPTPSLGSIVSISVNDEQIFQYRLQPRYEIIEQVAIYAVRFTYNYMLENKHQYQIY